MKIAIIGGDLLGCASAYNLARVFKHDLAKHEKNPAAISEPSTFDITLFEKQSKLGGSQFQSIKVEDAENNDREVEIGSVLTIANCPGSYVEDAITTVNGPEPRWWRKLLRKKTAPPQSRRLEVLHPWEAGACGEAVRSFAVFDWVKDNYLLLYCGWSIADWLERLAAYRIVRTVILNALWWQLYKVVVEEDPYMKVKRLLFCLAFFAVFMYTPSKVVKKYHRDAAFWGSTFSQMWSHGISVGVFRGTVLGLHKHIALMQNKNAATASVVLATLLERTGLKNYVISSANQFFERFKFTSPFTHLNVKGPVESQYVGEWGEINSLAALLCLQRANFTDSDARQRIVTLGPNNESLCEALLEVCNECCDLSTELSTRITEICELGDQGSTNNESPSFRYRLISSTDDEYEFDGVIVCAKLDPSEFTFSGFQSASIRTLLGLSDFTDDAKDKGESAYSHLAIVSGALSPSFFRYTQGKYVPDVVLFLHCPQVSFVERLFRGSAPVSVTKEQAQNWFVYRVVCNANFRSESFSQVFCNESKILHYGERKRRRSALVLSEEEQKHHSLVLGTRFINVAAARRVAHDVEWDLMNAANGATLFSVTVQWQQHDGEDMERSS
eukprot:Plantae.Rhodophyta-Hildenbrandia_rubra.ctg16979.p1 GENE.Plantae.Rhodophyta-Hildenbrandia_rubra.ctg16979~~Plantae.Rhodophyta-Hildenbrandia_rubra.ctg16979.p1  ORF type:complete len:614 (-),score=76.43 Plantae.Rhodophyta-Hildenbrandia_rubra.ctg16979:252-2093(-)